MGRVRVGIKIKKVALVVITKAIMGQIIMMVMLMIQSLPRMVNSPWCHQKTHLTQMIVHSLLPKKQRRVKIKVEIATIPMKTQIQFSIQCQMYKREVHVSIAYAKASSMHCQRA